MILVPMIHHVLRTLLLDESTALVGPRRSNDRQSARAAELNTGGADTSAGAVNKDGFTRLGVRALEQRAKGSAVRNAQGRTLSKRDFWRQRMYA